MVTFFKRNIYLGMDAKKLHDNGLALKRVRVLSWPHGLWYVPIKGLEGLQGDPRQWELDGITHHG